ncbi:MAG: hypothetical protein HYV46_01850 [candidate division NC10 bacterium]|nr:hypothetical protein [candidate division NC10 bacterium]MBI2454862.1 hypothetical protein [candidate division NC10 bacterium]
MNIRLGIVAATIALVGIAALPVAEAGVIKNREGRQQKRDQDSGRAEGQGQGHAGRGVGNAVSEAATSTAHAGKGAEQEAGFSNLGQGVSSAVHDAQGKRITQGVESGQLTAKETAKLERQQGKIEADREKALADGKMTRKEKAKLTREQNRASRRIYKEKHDAQKQPGAK